MRCALSLGSVRLVVHGFAALIGLGDCGANWRDLAVIGRVSASQGRGAWPPLRPQLSGTLLVRGGHGITLDSGVTQVTWGWGVLYSHPIGVMTL